MTEKKGDDHHKNAEVVEQKEDSITFDFSFLTKCKPELLFLLFFLFIFTLSISRLSTGIVDNETPAFFFARDAFWSSQMAITLDERGTFDQRSYYEMDGNTDASYHRPPLFGILSVTIANFAGISTLNAAYHLSLIVSLLLMLLIFLILRTINPTIAVLAMPLTLYIVQVPFYTYLTWGHWFTALNMVFSIAAAWAFIELDKKNTWLLLSIFISAGLLTHVRETIYFLVFPVAWFIFSILSSNFPRKEFLQFTKATVISLVISAAFLPYTIFQLTQKSNDPLFNLSLSVNPDTPLWSNFGFMKYILIVAIIAGLLTFFTTKNQSLRKAILFSLTFFALTFIGYLVPLFKKAVSQTRYFWPLVLAIVFGILLYTILTNLSSILKISKSKHLGLGIFVSLIITLILFNTVVPSEIPQYGYIIPEIWDGLKWIETNTGQHETVLYLFGDTMSGDSLFWMAKRPFAWVAQDFLLGQVGKNELSPTFKFGGSEAYRYEIKTGPLTYDYKLNPPGNKTICDYNYVYSARGSQYDQVTKYLGKTLNFFITNSSFTPVYQNPYIIILQNKNPGGPCFTTIKNVVN